MRPSPVIVREIRGQDAPQVPLAENDDMVQALASHRTDEPLREGVLPRAARGRQDFTDAHALRALAKRGAVDAVAIAQEVDGGGVVRKGVDDLLSGPVRGGVLSHIEMDDTAAMVGEQDKDEEDAQARG